MAHTCHAVNCEIPCPPRMLMHPAHWRMVPRRLQAKVYATYRPGQERRWDPSPAYLRAAAEAVRAVAEVEGQPEEDIAFEVGLYENWAQMAERDDA